MRVHLALAAAVVAAGIWLSLSVGDWAVLALTIAGVWVAELFNTAIEAVVDLASPEQHHLARTAKDVAAAAVLAMSAAAAVVGLLILGPAVWDRMSP
jgi:diacylglycerol kinase